MKQTTLKKYLDEVCDMLDSYGGRDKVITVQSVQFENCMHKTNIFSKKL